MDMGRVTRQAGRPHQPGLRDPPSRPRVKAPVSEGEPSILPPRPDPLPLPAQVGPAGPSQGLRSGAEAQLLPWGRGPGLGQLLRELHQLRAELHQRVERHAGPGVHAARLPSPVRGQVSAAPPHLPRGALGPHRATPPLHPSDPGLPLPERALQAGVPDLWPVGGLRLGEGSVTSTPL